MSGGKGRSIPNVDNHLNAWLKAPGGVRLHLITPRLVDSFITRRQAGGDPDVKLDLICGSDVLNRDVREGLLKAVTIGDHKPLRCEPCKRDPRTDDQSEVVFAAGIGPAFAGGRQAGLEEPDLPLKRAQQFADFVRLPARSGARMTAPEGFRLARCSSRRSGVPTFPPELLRSLPCHGPTQQTVIRGYKPLRPTLLFGLAGGYPQPPVMHPTTQPALTRLPQPGEGFSERSLSLDPQRLVPRCFLHPANASDPARRLDRPRCLDSGGCARLVSAPAAGQATIGFVRTAYVARVRHAAA